jgi:tetratricopeptide (TPR) repeat protein
MGDLQSAEPHLVAALRASPHDETRALDLGVVYLRTSKFSQAEQVLAAAAADHPKSTIVLLTLSLAEALGGKTTEAATAARKALSIDPEFAPARLLLSYSYYAAGDYAECVKSVEPALHEPGVLPYLYYLHASSLLKLNSTDFTRLSEELMAARTAMPYCALCYVAESRARQGAGDIAGAADLLRTVVTRIDPTFQQAWYRLSVLLEKLGQKEQASEARARLLTLQVNDEAAAETRLARGALLSTVSR